MGPMFASGGLVEKEVFSGKKLGGRAVERGGEGIGDEAEVSS